MKLFLTKILPLALPVIVYLTWLIYAQRRSRKLGTSVDKVSDAPWFLIGSSGVAVLIAGMLALGLFSGDKTGGIYIPPHMEDGKIVKGRIER